jgi:uncharacterized membrane protein YoaK (UPF0700 family)
MDTGSPAAAVGAAKRDGDGPLPLLLLILTFVTGLVDALSYLSLGHVFVANMTGNVVFLGFAIAGARDFSVSASLLALAAFLVGALAGGRLGWKAGAHRGRLLAIVMLFKLVLVASALTVAIAAPDPSGEPSKYTLIALLALAMGLQNATARRLAVADLTTTVLTLTLTGIAADSTLAGGSNPRPGRRLAATVTMLSGAAVGAFVVLSIGVVAVLATTLVLLVFNGIASYRAATSSDPWTVAAAGR